MWRLRFYGRVLRLCDLSDIKQCVPLGAGVTVHARVGRLGKHAVGVAPSAVASLGRRGRKLGASCYVYTRTRLPDFGFRFHQSSSADDDGGHPADTGRHRAGDEERGRKIK